MRRRKVCVVVSILLVCVMSSFCFAQKDSLHKKQFKNVVRYNISGAMLFGADRYIVLGYERVTWRNQSISINGGLATLPKLISINTNLFRIEKDQKNTGYNVSVDYRFYPLKDNKHPAPRGIYFGPYFSHNAFHRENRWQFINSANTSYVETKADFKINTFGFEVGYQFIFWKRVTLDLVMVGPGWGYYNYKVSLDGNLDLTSRSDLMDGLEQLITQRYPGANFIFAEKHLSADGVMKTTGLGYRYLIHLGFNF